MDNNIRKSLNLMQNGGPETAKNCIILAYLVPKAFSKYVIKSKNNRKTKSKKNLFIQIFVSYLPEGWPAVDRLCL
jgi:hypothetical protein